MNGMKAISTFFLLICFVGWGQNGPYQFDVLEKEIKQSTYFDSASVFSKGRIAIEIARESRDWASEALIYQYFGNYNYYSGRRDLANNYYDTSIYLAEKANDDVLALTGEIRKAYILTSDDLFLAEKRFTELLEIAEKRGDRENSFEAHNGLGILYEGRQNQPMALQYYLDALKIAEELNDAYRKGIAYNNLGLLKVRNNQYKEAKLDFEKGLIYADSSQEVRLAFNLHNNLGLLYYSEGSAESIKHYKITLQQAENLGFPYALLIAHLNLANSYGLNQSHKKAIYHAQQAVNNMLKTNNLSHFSLACYVMAESYLELNEVNNALQAVEDGISNAEQNNNINHLEQGFLLKSKINESLGNYSEALRLYKKHTTLRDSIEQLSNRERYDELQIAYETEKKEAELLEERTKLDLLKKDKDLLEKDSRLKESRLMLSLIVLVILLLSVVFLFYLRNTRIKKLQQKRFSQELIKSLDEERSRISRDLHDDIGQSLSAVKSRINLLKKGHDEDMDNLEENLGHVLEQTRKISHELHPSFLEKIGLRKSISTLLENIEKNTKIITSHDLSEEADNLSLDDQTQLYRILQECLSNTIRHANAKSIKVSISCEGDKMVFIYRDNGKGISKSDANFSEGIGMMTIKERIHKLKGKFTIGSNKGIGFRLAVKF